LRRTPDDLERLLALSPAPAVRIVKGAYKEPAAVAMQSKADVDKAFVRLVERCLTAGAHVNIATHDEPLINRLLARIDSQTLQPPPHGQARSGHGTGDAAASPGAGAAGPAYELQMLFGVRLLLQDRLVAAGRPLRIYTPFGNDWYGYYSRRLAERPANLGVVARGMFG